MTSEPRDHQREPALVCPDHDGFVRKPPECPFCQMDAIRRYEQSQPPRTAFTEKAEAIAGSGLYRLTEAERASLMKFAKFRNFDQLDGMARKEQIAVIAQWMETRATDLFAEAI